MLLRVQKGDPQGLKPAFWADLGGTAEAVPYVKPIFETGLKNKQPETSDLVFFHE